MKTWKHKKIVFGIGIPLLVIILVLGLIYGLKGDGVTKMEGYLSHNQINVTLYDDTLKEVLQVPRGTKVTVYPDDRESKTKEQTQYYKVNYEGKTYYLLQDNFTTGVNEIVKEKTMYVRTPVTLYKTATDSTILSMVKKGEELDVVGITTLEKGQVLKYQVTYQDQTGYVYGKYLTFTKEEAVQNYDEQGKYQIHKARGNTQGGGSGANLDYYPNVKPKFEQNVMPGEVRSLYLNSRVLGNVDTYIELAKQGNINAFVVDIKDNMAPGYQSEVMKKYSPTNYAKASQSVSDYQKAIQKLKEAGFYVIGRITVFKDYYYVEDHKESAILDKTTGAPLLHNGSYWPTAYNRTVWQFNVELAKEAVTLMGFNEIQFDYVRFPDRINGLESAGKIDLKNTYNEDKAVAIQNFLMYACDELHALQAYVSADVFGESAHHYITGYGQYFPAISNVVDVISGMPYPDHFNAHEYGISEVVWTNPYHILNVWGKDYVMKRQAEIPTPAVVRTWIQAYDTFRSPQVVYDSTKVYDEIRGLKDAGLTGGFMTWNASSSITKYRSLIDAFKKA